MRKMMLSSIDDWRNIFFFTKGDSNRWGNLRYDGTHKHTHLSRLGTQKATWNLRTYARLFEIACVVLRHAWRWKHDHNYLDVCQISFFPQINAIEQQEKAKFVSTRRGSSPLLSWDTKCPEHQISKSINWKRMVSRSPNLSPLDIFLRGSIKYRTYAEKIGEGVNASLATHSGSASAYMTKQLTVVSVFGGLQMFRKMRCCKELCKVNGLMKRCCKFHLCIPLLIKVITSRK